MEGKGGQARYVVSEQVLGFAHGLPADRRLDHRGQAQVRDFSFDRREDAVAGTVQDVLVYARCVCESHHLSMLFSS
eukprot:SAG11_NODE_21047_length_433_cov_0.769461_2_plen_75_part_01